MSIKIRFIVAGAMLFLSFGCRSSSKLPEDKGSGLSRISDTNPSSGDRTGAPHTGVGELLQTFIEQVNAGTIRRSEVFYEPPHIEHFAALTPEKLRSQGKYRIEIRYPILDQSLLAALRQTTVESSTQIADPVWALDVTLQDGSVREICLDASGRHGYIDGVAVSFSGEIHRWFVVFTGNMS